jgi:hypothetical protein
VSLIKKSRVSNHNNLDEASIHIKGKAWTKETTHYSNKAARWQTTQSVTTLQLKKYPDFCPFCIFWYW